MDSISLSGFTSISQWFLFLGIGLIIFGIVDKRERYILAGQIAFILLGLLAAWILLTINIPTPTDKSGIITKEIKTMSFFKGAIVMMAFSMITILIKFIKLPFLKISIYFLIFFALILFFMLFNIMQTPDILPVK